MVEHLPPIKGPSAADKVKDATRKLKKSTLGKMNSLRNVLSERFSKDVELDKQEQGDIDIEISTDEFIDDKQLEIDSNLHNDVVDEDFSEPEDDQESILRDLLEEAVELIIIQKEEIHELKSDLALLRFEQLSSDTEPEESESKKKRARPLSLGLDLKMTATEGISLMGLSLLWLIVLVGTDQALSMKGWMINGVFPVDLVTWSIGAGFWSFHMLHILTKAGTVLSLPLSLRIQTAIVIMLAIGTALIISDEEVRTVTNVWAYGSIFAFAVLLISGMGGAFARAYSRKFSKEVDEDPKVIVTVEKKEMKKKIVLNLVFGAILFIIIVSTIAVSINTFLAESSSCSANSSGRMMAEGSCPHKISVASWNLQNFGPSKSSNPDLISEIAYKISKYDVVAVQEIKDINQHAPYLLQDKLEEFGEFGIVLSSRTGSYCESKNTANIAEQYAFFHNIETTKSLDSGFHYPNDDCEFAREPFAARFQSVEHDFDFVLITTHVKPDDAITEISAMTNVLGWAKFQFPDEDDFIILGDLNADCNYASATDLNALEIRNKEYEWIVPDSASTNTATSSECAYDRIILEEQGSDEYLGAYSIDCQTNASDHCIVSAEFSAHES